MCQLNCYVSRLPSDASCLEEVQVVLPLQKSEAPSYLTFLVSPT